MNTLVERSRSGLLPGFAALLAACALFAVFAQGGSLVVLAVTVVALLVVALLVVALDVPPLLLVVASPLLLFIHRNSGYYWFDLAALTVAAGGCLRTLASGDRRSFDLHAPGWLAIGFLVLPVLALPVVIDLNDWLGGMKRTAFCCLVFFGLRRFVPRSSSKWLLLAFPLSGLFIAVQLFARIESVGGLLTTRPTFRNFYTNLGWGQSNYVAAILLLCIGGTLLFAAQSRRWPARLAAFAIVAVQLQAFLPMQSRAATIGLALLVASVVVGSTARVRVAALVGSALAAFAALANVSGQALVARFTNPQDLGSWMVRMELWKNAWERFRAHPWTGIGLAQGPYQRDLGGSDGAHSSFLQILMEVGVLGGILWLVFIAASFVLARRAVPPDRAHAPRTYRSLAFGLVLGVFVDSLVEPTVSGYEMAMLFSWFLAWLALQDPAADEQVRRPA